MFNHVTFWLVKCNPYSHDLTTPHLAINWVLSFVLKSDQHLACTKFFTTPGAFLVAWSRVQEYHEPVSTWVLSALPSKKERRRPAFIYPILKFKRNVKPSIHGTWHERHYIFQTVITPPCVPNQEESTIKKITELWSHAVYWIRSNQECIRTGN